MAYACFGRGGERRSAPPPNVARDIIKGEILKTPRCSLSARFRFRPHGEGPRRSGTWGGERAQEPMPSALLHHFCMLSAKSTWPCSGTRLIARPGSLFFDIIGRENGDETNREKNIQRYNDTSFFAFATFHSVLITNNIHVYQFMSC